MAWLREIVTARPLSPKAATGVVIVATLLSAGAVFAARAMLAGEAYEAVRNGIIAAWAIIFGLYVVRLMLIGSRRR